MPAQPRPPQPPRPGFEFDRPAGRHRRPATVDGLPAADVYRSGSGTDWTFAATLTTPAGFSPGLMNGGAAGAVLAGRSGPALTAFSWR